MLSDRRCEHEGCDTRLCSYNPGPCCYAHAHTAPELRVRAPSNKTRRPRPAPVTPRQPWESQALAA